MKTLKSATFTECPTVAPGRYFSVNENCAGDVEIQRDGTPIIVIRKEDRNKIAAAIATDNSNE